MGPYYITLHAAPDGIAWDLRSGTPDSTSVRIADGVAFTWQAATHQAGNVLARIAEERFR